MIRTSAALLGAALFSCITLFGQTAQIGGRITDSSDAVVPAARMELTNVATGTSRTTVSNGEGAYTIPLVQPGSYRLRVEADGFRTFQQENLVLEVEQSAKFDVVMQVGSTNESVVVTASAPLLQAGNASLGQVIESRQFNDMPLNDRSALGLISLSDAVITSRNFDPNLYSGANVFSAGGSRPGQK